MCRSTSAIGESSWTQLAGKMQRPKKKNPANNVHVQ